MHGPLAADADAGIPSLPHTAVFPKGASKFPSPCADGQSSRSNPAAPCSACGKLLPLAATGRSFERCRDEESQHRTPAERLAELLDALPVLLLLQVMLLDAVFELIRAGRHGDAAKYAGTALRSNDGRARLTVPYQTRHCYCMTI